MLEKITNMKQLSDVDKLIQNYILHHLKVIPQLSAREIASQIPCSPSTISRFIQKCGFASYRDFLYYVRDEANTFKNRNMADVLPLRQIFINQVFPQDINDKIKAVSRMLLEVDFIYCIGMGSSGVMADYAARKFNSIGLKAMSSNEPYAPFLSTKLKKDNDLMLIFSNSGETAEILELVHLLKLIKVDIVSITNMDNNTLAQLSTLNIPYFIENQRLKYNFDLSSQLPTIALIEFLVATCYDKLKLA